MTQSAAEPDSTVTPDAETATEIPARSAGAGLPRSRRLRGYRLTLDHAGVFVGFLFFVISLMPSLLPRTWPVQGLVSGISIAFGYAVGAFLGWTAHHVVPGRPSASLRLWSRRMVWLFAGIITAVMLWLGSAWQNDIRRAVHYPTASRYLYVGVLVVAALSALALVGVARVVRRVYRAVTRRLRRWVSPVAARITGAVLVAALVWGVLAGVVGNGLRALADEVFSAADHGSNPDTVQPTSPLRSGSPGSQASWDSLGREGRTFVAGGPTARQISRLTGRPALTPIRVYAGRESASSLQGEASLVLAELKRTHAFGRAVLALATSTGTGWVNPWEADPLEYMFGGDTAIASMQYSYYPSWISFLIDRPRAEEAGRVLFDTVYRYWVTLPPPRRPKLVVFGESLGSFGGSAAFKNVDDLLARTDGALFTGPPNTTTMWRSLTQARRPGSPERLPVVGDAEAVLFATGPKQLREPDGSLSQPQVVFLQHGSDPIVWWAPQLLWSEPDWLTEPRAPDVIPQVHWYPVVTFWQITADMLASTAPPPGYGHNYGPEIITAWNALLRPALWTQANTAALAEHGP